jgi:ribose/xylose/arabinose/galactoside ABC-type transport system permease subunit
MKKTKFGRSLYAIGCRPQSALLIGITVKRTKLMAHVLCGLLADIGGLLFALFAFIVLQSVFAGADLKGGLKLLLPERMRFEGKRP